MDPQEVRLDYNKIYSKTNLHDLQNVIDSSGKVNKQKILNKLVFAI